MSPSFLSLTFVNLHALSLKGVGASTGDRSRARGHGDTKHVCRIIVWVSAVTAIASPAAAQTSTPTPTPTATPTTAALCTPQTAISTSSSSSGSYSENILYFFNANDSLGDGWGPWAGLVTDKSGRLYGTTLYGGLLDGRVPPNYCDTAGEAFALAPPTSPGASWAKTALHLFAALTSNDGSNPYDSHVIGAEGSLYGTTTGGGASTYGTVFQLSLPATSTGSWNDTVLHSFSNSEYPRGALLIGKDGTLYGTALVES
jgi:uncharacterized repeat protein (TIGR03803 family)